MVRNLTRARRNRARAACPTPTLSPRQTFRFSGRMPDRSAPGDGPGKSLCPAQSQLQEYGVARAPSSLGPPPGRPAQGPGGRCSTRVACPIPLGDERGLGGCGRLAVHRFRAAAKVVGASSARYYPASTHPRWTAALHVAPCPNSWAIRAASRLPSPAPARRSPSAPGIVHGPPIPGGPTVPIPRLPPACYLDRRCGRAFRAAITSPAHSGSGPEP